MFFNVPEHFRPLRRHRTLSLSSFTLHFAASLLLLLVGLSLTIIKSIYLLRVHSTLTSHPPTSIATDLHFGVWGVCAKSVLTPVFNDGLCIGPKLGYDIPPEYLSSLGISVALGDILLKSLQAILILHIVAACLAFLALVFSLFLASQAASIIGLVLSIGTGIAATVMFVVDLALVIIARNKVREITSGLAVEWGNGVWMVLVAVICTWVGIVLLSMRTCYCCGIRRKDTY